MIETIFSLDGEEEGTKPSGRLDGEESEEKETPAPEALSDGEKEGDSEKAA